MWEEINLIQRTYYLHWSHQVDCTSSHMWNIVPENSKSAGNTRHRWYTLQRAVDANWTVMLSDCMQSSFNRLCGREYGCPGFYQSIPCQESSSRGERRLQLPHSSWGQSNKATFQRAKSKRQKETQNVQSLQHCRQSGRLLKIAGNRHTAGSQRQKAGRFPREQPQK